MWAQSFLLGVPKLLVGFRSKEGILQSMSEFKVRDIPGMVKRRRQTWDGNLSIKFMEHVLNCKLGSIEGDQSTCSDWVTRHIEGISEYRRSDDVS